MQLFYDHSAVAEVFALREEEARHAARVLRKRVGDKIDIVDGQGGWFTARIVDLDKKSCIVDAKLVRREARRAAHRSKLCVAPTKSMDRYEWLVEKATEIGVDELQPFFCIHSERTRLRLDRLQRVAETAMKQSLRAWIPRIAEPLSFEEVIANEEEGQKLMAYLGPGDTPNLNATYAIGSDATLLVGPEGGFSPGEAERAVAAGYSTVSLGPHRLRTETAAITALHTIESSNW